MLVSAAEKCNPLDLTSHNKPAKSDASTYSTEQSATTAESNQQASTVEQSSNVAEKQDQITCAHGSHVFKVKMYHDSLMKTTQRLADVAKITLVNKQMRMYSLHLFFINVALDFQTLVNF